MMWELAAQAWAIAGIPFPDYDRADAPIRVIRRGRAPKKHPTARKRAKRRTQT